MTPLIIILIVIDYFGVNNSYHVFAWQFKHGIDDFMITFAISLF